MSKYKTPAAACILSMLATGTVTAQQPLILEGYTVRDPQMGNQEAVQFAKPQGWKVSGGVKWYHHFAHLVCIEVKINKPNGLEQIETLPWCGGCWFTNSLFPMTRGSNYMGSLVLPPIEDPKEYVRTISLPQLRGRDARIVGCQEMPKMAKELSQSLGGMTVRSARVRVEYSLNGTPVEEDFYISLYVNATNMGMNNVAYMWGPAWTPFALRAPKGKLDAATPVMLTSVNSFRFVPKWFGDFNYVGELFQNRMAAGIADAVRISETTRTNGDAIFKKYSDAYWQRQATQDRLARQFSDMIRGVTQYQSPYAKYPVQLPSGYQYAWASANGGYVLSNTPGYNPNVGSTTTWQPLQIAR